GWRDKLFEGGKTALAGKEERSGEHELKRKIAELERALGRKTYELEIAAKALRGWECGPAVSSRRLRRASSSWRRPMVPSRLGLTARSASCWAPGWGCRRPRWRR